MKILTKRKQARILKHLIVMSKAVTELSQFYIPVTEYPKTADGQQQKNKQTTEGTAERRWVNASC